jgi:Divergent InlB B-repeat domain/S-layer homology domain
MDFLRSSWRIRLFWQRIQNIYFPYGEGISHGVRILWSILVCTSLFFGGYTSVSVVSAGQQINEFHIYAQKLAESKIIRSQSNIQNYAIENTISRGELAKIAANIANIEPMNCQRKIVFYYQDSRSSEAFCGYIEALVREGITTREIQRFRPNALATRAEVVKIISKAVTYANEMTLDETIYSWSVDSWSIVDVKKTTSSLSSAPNTSTSEQKIPYEDIQSSEIVNYVQQAYTVWCLGKKNKFNPSNTALRGEVFKLAACMADIAQPSEVTKEFNLLQQQYSQNQAPSIGTSITDSFNNNLIYTPPTVENTFGQTNGKTISTTQTGVVLKSKNKRSGSSNTPVPEKTTLSGSSNNKNTLSKTGGSTSTWSSSSSVTYISYWGGGGWGGWGWSTTTSSSSTSSSTPSNSTGSTTNTGSTSSGTTSSTGSTSTGSTSLIYYSLTTNSGTNGTILRSTNSGSYLSGTIVTLTANANSGYTWSSWSGCTSSTNTCNVTMNQSRTVSAVFVTIVSVQPMNGMCGTSQNQVVDIAPSINLCTTGTPSAVTGAWPWNWTCGWVNGGISVSCKAFKTTPSVASGSTEKFSCLPGAVTCVEIAGAGAGIQAWVPLTFGQPFKKWDWKHTQEKLTAMDGSGNILPLQWNEISSHLDGSARFAVLSTELKNLAPSERRVVSIFTGITSQSEGSPLVLPSSPDWDLNMEATVYTKQTSLVKFGNRNWQSWGTPFLTGETITLTFSWQTTESYTITVTGNMVGWGWPTLREIAYAFRNVINAQSTNYTTYKIGEWDGYENLWITTKDGIDVWAFDIIFTYTGTAQMSHTVLEAYKPPQVLRASPQAELERQIAQGVMPRLVGNVAKEYTVVVPFIDIATGSGHPQLTARLHTRFYTGGIIKTDAVIENNYSYRPNPGNIDYKIDFKKWNTIIYSQPTFTHYHHARWKKTFFFWGIEPQIEVRHHMPYFMKSAITWNYDLSISIAESIIKTYSDRLATKSNNPMTGFYITKYFPMTWGRDDIWPNNRYTSIYLITQDEQVKKYMLTNADEAWGIPIHYRDEVTNEPISLDNRPGVALLFWSAQAGYGLPSMKNSVTPWSVDTAHQSSLVYIPYVITGDAYYLDEMMFWASWNMGAMDPALRGWNKWLLHADQTRGFAWTMRSLIDIARILPDVHTMKNYYNEKLQNNLDSRLSFYNTGSVLSWKVSWLGMIEHISFAWTAAPWQNDFVSMVISLLVEDGDPKAQTYYNWLSNFTVGRFTHEQDGYCLPKAPATSVKIKNGSGYIHDWDTLFKETWPWLICDASTPVDANSFPDTGIGYAAWGRWMLAAAANVGYSWAKDAYIKWKAMTPLIDTWI